MRRRYLALVPALAIAVAGLGGLYVTSQGAAADEHTLEARAGDGVEGYSVDLFLPENITITTGTTVSWSFPWFEPHSVSFGEPEGGAEAPSHPGETMIEFDGETAFSSGLISGPDAEPFQVEFTTEGEYDIYCAIHPNMTGTVNVVDPEGDVEPDTQEDLDERAGPQYEDALAELQGIAEAENDEEIEVDELDDGSSQYTMEIGAESLVGVAMQYFPPSLEIIEGDSIRFVNEGFTPHTATFGEYPGGDPFELPVSAPEGAWDGEEFVNSGVMGQPWPAGTEFTITFANAGDYQVYCALHANQGQVASISVEEAEVTPTATPTAGPPTITPTATPTRDAPAPPDTGNAAPGSTSGVPMPFVLAGVAFVMLGAAALVAGRGRRQA